MGLTSGEIIGISIVAVVAVVIIIIYICKCYSDYSLGHHEQNVKPIDLDNDQELALISAKCSKPMPHDPYNADTKLANKDHNDLNMVSLSIEQFIRKESYLKSKRGDQKDYRRLEKTGKSSRSTGIEEDPGHGNYHGISHHEEEIDGGPPSSIKSPVANGNGNYNFNGAVEAPVIVHHSLQKPQETKPIQTQNEHIYAPVEKSIPTPAPSAPVLDAPTYFRPIKPTTKENFATPPPPSFDAVMNPQVTNDPITAEVMPAAASTMNQSRAPSMGVAKAQDSNNGGVIPTPARNKPKKVAQTSIENVPPNEQEITKESLFYVPDEALSPRTPKKSRRTTERTVKTLDDLGVTPEKPKTPRKTKKANGKGEGAPKTHKKRKKSVPELDIAKPIKTNDIEPIIMSPKSPRPENTNSMGLKSPPIPPKPQINPLLSPTVRTRNEGNARVSQL